MAYFVNAFLEVDYTPFEHKDLIKCGNYFEKHEQAVRFQKDIQKLLKGYGNNESKKE